MNNMKYYNSETFGYLEIKKRQEGLNNYWIFINFYSNSIDNSSRFSLELRQNIYIKNNNIYNSEILASEGSNQIYGFVHQNTPHEISNDENFISVGMKSYYSSNDNDGTKMLGKDLLTKEDYYIAFSDLINALNLTIHVDSLNNLLLPSIYEIDKAIGYKCLEEKENVFKEYQKLVNSLMMPLRKEVYKRKYCK